MCLIKGWVPIFTKKERQAGGIVEATIPYAASSLAVQAQQHYEIRAIDETDDVGEMETDDVDVVVLSACVQMPSLRAVPRAEAITGKPVVTAAIATTWAMLKALDLDTLVPGGGALLSGKY